MTNFILHSNTAKLEARRYDESGLYELIATGLWTRRAIVSLSAQAVPQLQDATALVLRLDAALVTIDFADWPEPDRYAWWNPPVAVIVSPETHASAVAHSQTLAEAGLIQAVFLPAQAARAYHWAARHAALAHQAVPA